MNDPMDWSLGDYVLNENTGETVLVDFPLMQHHLQKMMPYRSSGDVERMMYERAGLKCKWLRPATHESLGIIAQNRHDFGFEG